MELPGDDPEADALRLSDALDVVQWYQFQIAVKLSRASWQDEDDEVGDDGEDQDEEMKSVLADTKTLLGRKLDILGMDACLMSMAEVGYQMRENVEYTVGSEETEPLGGWPYDTILDALTKNPAMTPLELSKLIVDKYVASYGPGDGVTQSACDLSVADKLATAVSALASALRTSLSDRAARQRILSIRYQAQSYEVADNIDLVDFCSLMADSGTSSAITTACQDVIQAARSGYVVAQSSKGADMKNSNGVAIYFPTKAVSPLYAGLDFSKKTGWDDFLKAYVDAIRSR